MRTTRNENDKGNAIQERQHNIATEMRVPRFDDNNREDMPDASWNDYDEKGPWILPEGAIMIVKQMAAEQIFSEAVHAIYNCELDDQSPSVDHDHGEAQLDHLLRQFPGLCHRTYEIKWDNDEIRNLYPLAILCCLKPKLSLLKFVYQVNPKALFHRESVKGTLPFHYACQFQAPLDVIDWMIHLDPTLVRTPRSKDQVYPLHAAAYCKASLDVVNRLIQAWPEVGKQQDSISRTVLHAAAFGQASLDVVRRLHSLHPSNISVVDKGGHTPLHLACLKKGASPEVVSYLLSCAPQALHVAEGPLPRPYPPVLLASHRQSLEVLRILLPEGTPPPPVDGLGMSVLHFAAIGNTVDVVEYLLERYPDMAFLRSSESPSEHSSDHTQHTPIHTACHFGAPLANVKALVKHAPTTLLMVDGFGNTPLELAEHCQVSANLIDYLTDATNIQRKARAKTLEPPVQNNHHNS